MFSESSGIALITLVPLYNNYAKRRGDLFCSSCPYFYQHREETALGIASRACYLIITRPESSQPLESARILEYGGPTYLDVLPGHR